MPPLAKQSEKIPTSPGRPFTASSTDGAHSAGHAQPAGMPEQPPGQLLNTFDVNSFQSPIHKMSLAEFAEDAEEKLSISPPPAISACSARNIANKEARSHYFRKASARRQAFRLCRHDANVKALRMGQFCITINTQQFIHAADEIRGIYRTRLHFLAGCSR